MALIPLGFAEVLLPEGEECVAGWDGDDSCDTGFELGGSLCVPPVLLMSIAPTLRTS